MPNLRNAKKALRQAHKKAAENLIVKVAYKKAIKTLTKALEAGEKDVAAHVQHVQKKLGKAVKKGILKPNTASRKLSRLMKHVNSAKTK